MAVSCLFDLGPNGWVTDGRKMLDKVMGWIYASDSTQSYYFSGDILSVARVVQENAGNLEKAAAALQERLLTYLSRFFDEVQVECRIVDRELKGNHLFGEVILRATMIDYTGQTLDLVEVMTNKGSTARTVLDYDPYVE